MQSTSFFTNPYPQAIRRSVAVVGGGVMGLWTALAIATQSQGHIKVRLFEAQQVGHAGAASADATRVFRHLHGPDQGIVRWTLEAGAGWEYISRLITGPSYTAPECFFCDTGSALAARPVSTLNLLLRPWNGLTLR